ncbi:capsid cement protein [uncultured Tateyamaria sp.]|uniref:capsid cement protein n=1 Tax=uncultured Tateyamaria sp. TaxID=455651 RepID=UPI002607D40A|nr:capsid cement protein [uncultured Tateyamaria sp.]
MGQKLSSICALNFTVTLTSDVSTHRFVNVNAAQAGDGEAAIGVAANDEKLGRDVAVEAIGVFDMIAGAAIAKGAEVQSDANGKPIIKAAGAANGLALTAAANPGDIVKILIK